MTSFLAWPLAPGLGRPFVAMLINIILAVRCTRAAPSHVLAPARSQQIEGDKNSKQLIDWPAASPMSNCNSADFATQTTGGER